MGWRDRVLGRVLPGWLLWFVTMLLMTLQPATARNEQPLQAVRAVLEDVGMTVSQDSAGTELMMWCAEESSPRSWSCERIVMPDGVTHDVRLPMVYVRIGVTNGQVGATLESRSRSPLLLMLGALLVAAPFFIIPAIFDGDAWDRVVIYAGASGLLGLCGITAMLAMRQRRRDIARLQAAWNEVRSALLRHDDSGAAGRG